MREVLESLFATIAGEGEGCALFVAAWVLVRPWFAGVGCTLHARIFPFGAGQVVLTGVM